MVETPHALGEFMKLFNKANYTRRRLSRQGYGNIIWLSKGLAYHQQGVVEVFDYYAGQTPKEIKSKKNSFFFKYTSVVDYIDNLILARDTGEFKEVGAYVESQKYEGKRNQGNSETTKVSIANVEGRIATLGEDSYKCTEFKLQKKEILVPNQLFENKNGFIPEEDVLAYICNTDQFQIRARVPDFNKNV